MDVDAWLGRYREKFAPYEVPGEDREQLITEGEVGTYPGDDTLMPRIERSGRKEFDQLKSQRLDLTGQVKQARQREKELHPYPKLERFADRVLGYVPGILSPDVPTPVPSAATPKTPTVSAPIPSPKPSRFEVEDGEIIDTKNRQIVAPHEFNRLSSPQEQDEVAAKLQAGGYLMDEPATPAPIKKPTPAPTSFADAPVDLEIPEVHVVGERPQQPNGPRSILNEFVDDAKQFVSDLQTAPSPKSLGEAVTESAHNFMQGVAGIPAGALKSIAIASKSLDEIVPDAIRDDRPIEERATYKLGQSIDKLAKQLFPSNPELQKNFFVSVVPRALGSMTGFVGGAAVGALAKAPLTTGGVLGAQVGGAEQYDDATQHGASDEVKQKAFWFGSAVGVSEIAPVGALLNRFNKATGGGFFKVLKEGGVTAAQEFVQEYFQQAGNNIIAQQLYDENRSWLGGTLESGSAGGVSGGITGLISGMLQGRKARKQQRMQEGGGNETPFAGEPTPPPQPQAPSTPDLVAGIPDNLTVAQKPPFLVKKFPSPSRPAPEVVPGMQAPEPMAPPAQPAPLPQLPAPALEPPPIVPPTQATAAPDPLPGAVLSGPIPETVPPGLRVPASDLSYDTRAQMGDELGITTEVPAGFTQEELQQMYPDEYQQEPLTVETASESIAPEIAPAIAPDSAEVSPTPENVLDAQAHEAATSPTNDLPEPTQAMKEAGNYKLGHARIAGLDISIENPQGSTRSGVDQDGKTWEQEMTQHYGYIRGVPKGKDGDHLDVFVNPTTPQDYSGDVFVVDQVDPKTGKFDETKTLIGFKSLDEARRAYLGNYRDDWNGLGNITKADMDAFKQWLQSGKTTKPFSNAPTAQWAKPVQQIAPTPDQVGKQEIPSAATRKPATPQPATTTKQDERGNPELDYSFQKRPTVKQIIADWRQAGRPKEFKVVFGETEATFKYEDLHGIPQWWDQGNRTYGIDRNKVLDALKAEKFEGPEAATPPTPELASTAKPLRGSDNSVRDHSQRASVDGDTITIRSYVGNRRAGSLTIPLDEWKRTEKGPSANPNYNRHVLMKKYAGFLDDQPGGPGQAQRIRDSMERAIQKALATSAQANHPTPPTPERVSTASPSRQQEATPEEAVKPNTELPQVDKSNAPKAEQPPTPDKIEYVVQPLRPGATPETLTLPKEAPKIEGLPEDTNSSWHATQGTEKPFGKYKGYASTNEGGFLAVHDYGETGEKARDNARRLLAEKIKQREEARKPASKPAPPTPEAVTAPTEQLPGMKVRASQVLADSIVSKLNHQRDISTEELFRLADSAFGGTQARGTYTPKDAFDALELGVNQYLHEVGNVGVQPTGNVAEAQETIDWIRKNVLSRLPTQQNRRTEEQEEFQQFSTPPDLAMAMTWAADVSKRDTVLEPSAGLGGLAVFADNAGAKVYVNEFSPRRADLLKSIGFDGVFTENAEQLNNVLPDTIKPTVVIMNPPFSSTAGRKSGERATANVFAHLDQALKRLEPGGRLVALIGKGKVYKDPKILEDWLKKTAGQYAYRARIGLSGEGYKKYGTTYSNQILIFDKVAPDNTAPVIADFADVRDALPALKEVRDARTPVGQSTSAQPASETLPVPGEPESGPRRPVRSPASAVGVPTGESVTPSKPASAQRPTPVPGQLGDVDTAASSRVPDRQPRRPAQSVADTAAPPKSPVRQESGPSRPERAGSATDGGSKPGLPADEISRPVTLEAETSTPADQSEMSDSVYESYQPKKVKIAGAKKHPGKLVESAALAAVDPPPATYAPHLPKKVISDGLLSDAQLESVVYAGQAHEQFLPNGERRGFFLGDGPGVGKGRQIAGIILDNWQQGRKKAVWLSETQNLVNSAVRDWEALGGKPADLFGVNKFTRDQAIPRENGILYTTYTTMASGLDVLAGGKLKAKQAKGQEVGTSVKTRLDQVLNWLGPDFDGVLIFDEAHNMQNSLEQETERGDSRPAAKALASVTLQQKLPKARIVYASATAASRVDALAYSDRVGLWGEGTAFASKTDFVNSIASSGLGAMEIVAQNMKAMGGYISRNLDYRDVRYRKLEHPLTDFQAEGYNEMAKMWQVVFQNLEEALKATGVMGVNRRGETTTKNAAAKSAALAQFWGANQRFFNQVLTSMQMPSVLEDMKKQLAADKSILVQLVNTNESIMARQLQNMEQSGGDLEGVDMTPLQNLIQYVESAFPIHQMEEYTDEDGNTRTRLAKDSQGNPVINKEAVQMRDALIEKVTSMKVVPEGPLELILNTFGPGMVAEVTGRSERVLRIKDEEEGTTAQQREKRSPAAVREDVTAFMAGKKRILVFSDKGGTGESYHADKTKKNQQQRVHYLIQPGWRADKAVQGLGRSHRTNQASAPEYVLTMTNIKGHKRFISTIARRLDQLGALTKGQRQAGSSGLIDAKDNLENEYAAGAIRDFFRGLFRGQGEGMSFADVTKSLGLSNLVDKDGRLIEERIPSVPQFMNRVLALELTQQDTLFEQFISRMERAVEYAEQQGTLDTGMETYRADGGIKLTSESVIDEDPTTGAKVNLSSFDAKHSVSVYPAKEVEKLRGFKGYLKSQKTGKIWAQLDTGTQTKESGEVVSMTKLQSPVTGKYQYVEGDVKRLYDGMEKEAGRKAWEAQLKEQPTHHTERFYMVTGNILKIWDRFPKESVAKIRRVQTDDGKRYLGRMLSEAAMENLKVKLGKGEKPAPRLTAAQAFEAVLEEGSTLRLANDWQIKQVRVSNEPRVEVTGPDVYRSADILKSYGVFPERIGYTTRYFVPTDAEKGPNILQRILQFKPIVDVLKRGAQILKEERGSISFGGKAKYAGEADAYRKQRAQEEIGFMSSDPDIEARVRQAKKGLQPASLYDKLKDHVGQVWHLVSREFEHLPDTAQFSTLRTDLLKLQKYKGIAADKIQRDLSSIIKPLSRKQYDQLEWKALLSDLSREAGQGHALPFGYTPEKVQEDLDRLNEIVERDPKVQEAWEKRQRLWEKLKGDYKGAMDAIGFDVSKKLTKQDYFRHQVLEHAKQGAVSGAGSKVRTPTGRGFLKTRKGSSFDINANYVQAEFEVMAQMVYDTELAKVIKHVDRDHNIKKQLEAEAKTRNKEALAALIEESGEAGMIIESQLKDFKKRMGMHMAMLKKALELEKDDEIGMKQVAAIADDLESPGNPSARGFLKAVNERKAYIQDLLGPKYLTWDRLIPDTHELWQPREGNVFYFADSIPANLAKALQEGMLEEAGFPVEKLRKVLAQGGAREEYVIPKEASATLDNLSKPVPNWFVQANRQLLGHWKQLMLIAPRKVIRYNVRNLTGDADALFVGNPSAFARVPQAAKELMPVIFKDEQLTGEAKQWAERGGYGTTLQFQELGDVNELKAFAKTLDRESKGGILSMPLKAFNGYWKAARLSTDYREAMFRYAAYLDYLKQMQANNGKPKNFGASKPETVMALPDIRDRAFKLSNELLGAYDRVSVAGHTIRNFWIPFYSWMEVNATRYLQLTKNALDSGNGGQLKRGAFLSAKQAAGFMIRLSMFWSMLQAWNYMMFGDDEDELRDANPTVANRPHILFGRDENGKIQYLSGIGALGDLLAWFGLDAFPGLMGDIMHDRITIGEALQNAAKAPVNKIWQGITPTVKMPIELSLRESTYPDVFHPRPINDRGDYLGNQTTFGPEIQAAKGKPGKPLYGAEDLTGLLVQRSDPKSSAYGTWNGIERKYLERMGKDSPAIFWRSPRGEAISNWARAIAEKDTEAINTWKGEYEKLEREKHGTKFTTAKMYHDIEASLRAKAPLAGVTKAERETIMKQLDAQEKRTLTKAEQYYRETILQVLPASRRYSFEHKLEQRGWLQPDYGFTPESIY